MTLTILYSRSVHYDNGESNIFILSYSVSLTQLQQELDISRTDDMELMMSSGGLKFKLAIDTGESIGSRSVIFSA